MCVGGGGMVGSGGQASPFIWDEQSCRLREGENRRTIHADGYGIAWDAQKTPGLLGDGWSRGAFNVVGT